MNDKFKQKLEQRDFYYVLKDIYDTFKTTSINIGFLLNYCRAYSFRLGVYYFTPFVEKLEESIEEIVKDLYDIVTEEEEENIYPEENDEFIKNFYSKMDSDNVIFDD